MLLKKYKCLVLFFIAILGSNTVTLADSIKGCIAVFHNNTPVIVEVNLPAFEGGKFNTSQFHFKNLPSDMIPNNEGKYCYSLQDKRFAFVHTYYYAVSQIESYNQIFKTLHLPLPKSLTWKLTLDPTSPSGGFTELTIGAIHYPNFAVDPTTIAHELGHWVAFNAMQKNPNKIRKRVQPSYKIYKFSTSRNDIDPLQESEGVDEGSATILGSLFTGITIQDATDSYDFKEETINNYVQIPGLISSVRYTLEQAIESAKFSKAYPAYVADLKKALDENTPFLDFADPYATSAVINQPLWQAATRFGANKIKLIYVDAMAQLNLDQDYTYADLARTILISADKFDSEIKIFLQNEFMVRGIKL